MRLIYASTLQMHQFAGADNASAFAILSHTWGDQECTLQDMEDLTRAKVQSGFTKIKSCCDQAMRDGLEWAWIDTCCIDKTSSAELSEAINSMYRWYQEAAICYAYLSDVDNLSNLARSRWFTRGWTLQELLAPKDVLFYSSNWTFLGSKLKIADELSRITNIDTEILTTGDFSHISIAVRFSWAASRQTTRLEDIAYCLMGIVNVNMPLLYGEGKKAFIRLQEEILKISDDYSIFAWGLPLNIRIGDEVLRPPLTHGTDFRGMFADHPRDFTRCNRLNSLENWTTQISPTVVRGVVEITLPIAETPTTFAALPFTLDGAYDFYICMFLLEWKKGRYARWKELVLVSATSKKSSKNNNVAWETRRVDIAPPMLVRSTQPQLAIRHIDISQIPNPPDNLNYILDEVYALPHVQYSEPDGEITLLGLKRGPYAVLFFRKRHRYGPTSEVYSALRIPQVPTEYDVCGSVERIRDHKVSESHSRQPRFAIVLGTDSSGGFWSQFFHILGDDTSDEDFHFLLQREPELTKYCMKKAQLKSALNDHVYNKPFSFQRGECFERGWIERRVETFTREQGWDAGNIKSTKWRRNWSSFEKVRDVFVDVDIPLQWRNLVEKKMVFHIKVHEEETSWKLLKRWGDQPRVVQGSEKPYRF